MVEDLYMKEHTSLYLIHLLVGESQNIAVIGWDELML